jgi:hypothetical protein
MQSGFISLWGEQRNQSIVMAEVVERHGTLMGELLKRGVIFLPRIQILGDCRVRVAAAHLQSKIRQEKKILTRQF